jgi:mobilome CxxCx(11)CxxC protein
VDPGSEEYDLYRTRCWDDAVHTFATSFVFQQRAQRRHKQLRWVNYVGVAVPLVVGGLVAAFGSFGLLPLALGVAGVIGVGQSAVNLWSLVTSWIEDYSYSTGSASANDSLSVRFGKLAENPPPEIKELREAYDRLKIEDTARRDRDTEKGVTEEEKRMGMRAALRKFRRACAGCDRVPTTMASADCGVCGNFKFSG